MARPSTAKTKGSLHSSSSKGNRKKRPKVVGNDQPQSQAVSSSKGGGRCSTDEASTTVQQWSTAHVQSLVALLHEQDFAVTAATLQVEADEALLNDTADAVAVATTKTNECNGRWVWVSETADLTTNKTASTASSSTAATTTTTTAEPATTTKAARKAPTTSSTSRRSQSSGESSSESSDDDDDNDDDNSNSSSSSSSSSSSDENENQDKEDKVPTPKQQTATTADHKKLTKTKTISPSESSTTSSNSDESDDDDGEEEDNSSVSDVDVSDVSSVDVSSSSSSEEENESAEEDSDDSEEDDSDDGNDDDTNALTRQRQAKLVAAADQAKAAAKAALEWQPKTSPAVVTRDAIVTTPGSDGAQALNGSGKPFARVDSDYWGQVAQQDGGAMADNSYEAVFSNSGFGAKSNDKLQTVRGKDFTREKNKRKRSFNGFSRNGGRIDTDTSFSTKYVYND
jgi:SRP40, C-terminal domain